MGRSPSKRECQTCGKPGVRKGGKTSAGKQRWRCTNCGTSTIKTREDTTELALFTKFLTWVRSKDTQNRFDDTATGRTARRHFAWCWKIPIPQPPITGIIDEQLFIDGTYLPFGWCLLLARNERGFLTSWQWCDQESAASYHQLFKNVAPPSLVVTDGQGGALKALREHWPNTPVQRCLLHVHRNNIRDLTRNPKTAAGKALKGLSHSLLDIFTTDQAATWVANLAAFHNQYANYLKERTYARDNPEQAALRGKKPTGWWYTHERDRRVYHRLNNLYQQGQLFAYLTVKPGTCLERTTNPVESLNALVKQVPKHHPGLTGSHMTSAVEWTLYNWTETPQTPRELLKAWNHNKRPTRRVLPKRNNPPRPEGPTQYDTGLTAEEGLWTRKGWAGRPH